MSLLNQRQYPEAADLLEREHSEQPGDRHVAVLLAQAHLGIAHLEMLDLADAVMGSQPGTLQVDLGTPPGCDNGPIHGLQSADPRCVLARILQYLPAPDDAHVLRAQELLRTTYPDPQQTPTDINFLAAYVEIASALSRVKAFIGQDFTSNVSDEQFALAIHHAKRVFTELQQGLRRARYSYGKVSKFVVSLDGMPLIEIDHEKLVFNESIDVPQILRFAGRVLHDEAASVDQQLNAAAGAALAGIGSGLIQALKALDIAYLGGDDGKTLQVMWQFENGINTALTSLAESMERNDRIDIFELAWKNPPRIFKNLADAAKATWDQESAAPLRAYFAETQADWDEMDTLRAGWASWVNDSLRPQQRDQLETYLRAAHESDPRLGGLPAHLTLENLGHWQTGFSDSLEQALNALLDGSAGVAIGFEAQQAVQARDLLTRSHDWIQRNLWSM